LRICSISLLALLLLLSAAWANLAIVHQLSAPGIVSIGICLSLVRNFNWRTETDYTERWEQRAYDLSKLRSLDLFLVYWMGPTIAHAIMSFGFEDGRHLDFSIEQRRTRDDQYSAIAGFFKTQSGVPRLAVVHRARAGDQHLPDPTAACWQNDRIVFGVERNDRLIGLDKTARRLALRVDHGSARLGTQHPGSSVRSRSVHNI
jgi:hypothetical protein